MISPPVCYLQVHVMHQACMSDMICPGVPYLQERYHILMPVHLGLRLDGTCDMLRLMCLRLITSHVSHMIDTDVACVCDVLRLIP